MRGKGHAWIFNNHGCAADHWPSLNGATVMSRVWTPSGINGAVGRVWCQGPREEQNLCGVVVWESTQFWALEATGHCLLEAWSGRWAAGIFSLLALPSAPFLSFPSPGRLLPGAPALFPSLPRHHHTCSFSPPEPDPHQAGRGALFIVVHTVFATPHSLMNKLLLCVQMSSSSWEMAQAFGHWSPPSLIVSAASGEISASCCSNFCVAFTSPVWLLNASIISVNSLH